MTATRQERHKARAARAAEPHRLAKTEQVLRDSLANGTEVVVRMRNARLLQGAWGRVVTLEVGSFVVVEGAGSRVNVPWSKVYDAYVPEPV